MATNQLFSFQGHVYSGVRGTAGAEPTTWTWLGNASEASLGITANTTDKLETFSGSRTLYGRLITSRTAELTLTLDEFETENLALALHSDVATASDNIPIFTLAVAPERWIKFEGINTVTGEKVRIDLYRTQFNPVAAFALINNEWGGLQLTGAVLYDTDNAADPDLGGYGRLQRNYVATP